MLESKTHAHFWNNLNYLTPNLFNNLIKRALKELLYLFLPEDTSTKTGSSQNDLFYLKGSTPRSTMKVLFWVVVSVAITLVMGQLQ